MLRQIEQIFVDRELLGLGWNLANLETEDALAEAQEIFREIIAREGPKGHDPNTASYPPIAAEAIDYLLPLLAPGATDEKLRLETLHDELGHAIHWVTPLAVDSEALRKADLLEPGPHTRLH